MTQVATVSSEVRNIVTKFFANKARKGELNIFKEMSANPLVVSLYAMLPDANRQVIEILRDSTTDLTQVLSNEEISLLLENFSAVAISGICNKRASYITDQGKCNLPIEVIGLCHKIADCEPGSKIFLPYAGDCMFANGLPKDCQCKGFEISRPMWAISQITLYALGIQADIAIGDYQKSDERFDYIFCFPPILGGQQQSEIIRQLTEMAMHNLAPQGELYCILPNNFCSASSGWFNLRKVPFETREHSTLVVTLPSGVMHPVSGMELCLFSLKRNFEDKVVLVNATDESFVSHVGLDKCDPLLVTLKPNSIVDTILSDDERFVWGGAIGDLNHDLDMSPTRYLQVLPDTPLQDGEQMIPLRSLIEEVELSRENDLPLQLPLVGMKELSFNYQNCELSYNDIPVKDRRGNRVLTSDCLLLGFIGGKFKVARLRGVSQDHPVALRSEVFPFKLRTHEEGEVWYDDYRNVVVKPRKVEDIITEDFLLRTLLGEYVAKQGNAKAAGVGIKRIKREDNLSFDIILPKSIAEQERICKDDTRKTLSDVDRQKIESYEEFRKDMHMKKHAIGQTLFNINNWWKLLQKAREKGSGIVDDNAEVGKIRKVKVADIYANLDKAMSKLSLQLSKFDTGYGLHKEDIALTEFIEKYIAEHKSPNFVFEYLPSKHRAQADLPVVEFDEQDNPVGITKEFVLKEGDPIEYVKFSPEALGMIFDNIVSNAVAHGFAGRENDLNIIRIEITSEGTDYIVTISNNGSPLKSDLNAEDVFIYGQTSGNTQEHFGIGGYEVRKLMREFNDDAEFFSSPLSDFPVAYKLIFHDTNITAEISL